MIIWNLLHTQKMTVFFLFFKSKDNPQAPAKKKTDQLESCLQYLALMEEQNIAISSKVYHLLFVCPYAWVNYSLDFLNSLLVCHFKLENSSPGSCYCKSPLYLNFWSLRLLYSFKNDTEKCILSGYYTSCHSLFTSLLKYELRWYVIFVCLTCNLDESFNFHMPYCICFRPSK